MTLAEGIGLVIAGAGWPVEVFAAWMARRQWHLRQPAVRWRRSNQPDGNTIIEGRVLTDREDADCVIV